MNRNQVSVTAQGTAAMRAIESEKPAADRICYDPLARPFAGAVPYFLIRLFASYGERRTGGALAFIICRCRYFDDYLQACLTAGTGQVVILGAGLDSRAYREAQLQAIKTFEVDHPATQASKIGRVKKVLGKLPDHVTYVPVDFNTETLDKLMAAGFDRSVKSLFIWEGVTFYLQAEAVDATLAWVRANAAPGSAVIFDYQQFAAPTQRSYLYSVLSRLSGERRTFGIRQDQVAAFLTQRGFTRVVVADAAQLKRLYCTGSNQRRKVAENYGIAQAEVR